MTTTVRFGKKEVELPIVVEGNTAKVVRGGVVGTRGREQGKPSVPADTPAMRPGLAVAGDGSNPSPAPTYRSKTEARYAQHLDVLKFAGEIKGWWHEPFNVRLPGKRNYHRIDFFIWFPDGHVEIHQTKGWHKNLREGMTKAKTAAGLHPWATHLLVKLEKGAWQYRRMV